MSKASSWRGRLDLVTDRIVLSGDLPRDEVRAVEALTGWQAAGVTHVLDTRAELDEGDFLRRHAPGLTYGRIPTEDDGYAKPDWQTGSGLWSKPLPGVCLVTRNSTAPGTANGRGSWNGLPVTIGTHV